MTKPTKPAKPIDFGTVREAARILTGLEETFPELHGPHGWKPALRKAVDEGLADLKEHPMKSALVAFRFPAPLLERIDAYAERMGLSRAAAVRVLVTTALEAAPPTEPASKPRRKPRA